MTVVGEAECTLQGTVQVVINDAGGYDVQTTGADQSAIFTVRHPNGDDKSAIAALSHYLHGEAYRRNKAEAELAELKYLLKKAYNTDTEHTEASLALKQQCLNKINNLIAQMDG